MSCPNAPLEFSSTLPVKKTTTTTRYISCCPVVVVFFLVKYFVVTAAHVVQVKNDQSFFLALEKRHTQKRKHGVMVFDFCVFDRHFFRQRHHRANLSQQLAGMNSFKKKRKQGRLVV